METLGMILDIMFWITLMPILITTLFMIGAYIYVGIMKIYNWVIGGK